MHPPDENREDFLRPSSMPFLPNATRLVEQFIERLIENNFGMFFWNVLATVDEPIHQHKMTTKQKGDMNRIPWVNIDVLKTYSHKGVHVS
ncbi:hypothetical protein GLN3_00210 [Geobacillus lituanicus]|nr:hypothetical protein GLN3_00210 [Geobacillus lituanicus]